MVIQCYFGIIKSNYGKDAVDILGIDREFILFIGSEMPHTQRLNEFILDFERKADLIDLTEKNRLYNSSARTNKKQNARRYEI